VVGAGPTARISPTGLLESMPAKVTGTAREWERHLSEMETGLPLGAAPGTRPRPEYDPVARSLFEREKAKAAELGAGLRTVQRMRRRYLDQGLWGLEEGRRNRAAGSRELARRPLCTAARC
jgi:putative transposase